MGAYTTRDIVDDQMREWLLATSLARGGRHEAKAPSTKASSIAG